MRSRIVLKNETLRTSGFFGFAVIGCIAAILTFLVTRPPSIDDFEWVGKPFFDHFKSSNQAKSLEVIALGDNVRTKRFSVRQVDGLWVIPSHGNYPAEALDRLARTSSSVIGLEREALAGRLESEHEKLGVVDPASEDIVAPEVAGQRLILKDEHDNVLADLIIGKKAESIQPQRDEEIVDADPAKYYYVRRADESQTYKVRLKIDLSTRFSDWIAGRFFPWEPSELVHLDLPDRSRQKANGSPQRDTKMQPPQPVGSPEIQLRKSDRLTWTVKGLNPTNEVFDESVILKFTELLSQIQVVDVRKQTQFKGEPILGADLTLNPNPQIRNDQLGFSRASNQFAGELGEYGFRLKPIGPGKFDMENDEGEIRLGTANGLMYTLMFGNVATQTSGTIDLAGTQPTDLKETTSKQTGRQNNNATNKDRFLLVRVQFEESLLGKRPTMPKQPIRPIEPVGYFPSVATSSNDQSATSDVAPIPTEVILMPKKTEQVRTVEFREYDVKLKKFHEANMEYELQLSRYHTELKARQQQIEAGKQMAEAAHQKMAKWYYVVEASVLDEMPTNRSYIVVPKE